MADAMTISDIAIRQLIQHRIHNLGGEAFDTNELGYFLVIEAGDSIKAIQTQIGFNILCNRFTGTRYDQTGYTPSFEFIEEFPSSFDMVFVLDESGYGVEVFVPKEEGIDIDLIAMCRMFAFRSDEHTTP